MTAIRNYVRKILLEGFVDLPIPPPPAESVDELGSVIKQYYNRFNSPDLQYDLDERMELLFNEVVENNGGQNVVEYVKELKQHPLEIVSALKKHFARKRPEDVAADFAIDWKGDTTEMNTINNSFSYPSGHAAQSYYVALVLSDIYPQLRDELFEVAEAVAQSRIDRGVHFPSDLDAGRLVANQLYQQNKKSTPVILEGMVSPNSVSGKYAIWADISADQAGNLDEDLTSIDFLMYDWFAATEYVQQMMQRPDYDPDDGVYSILEAITDSAVACMRVRPYADGVGCNSAWEVIRSAADSGLGPTIYDLIMSIAPNGLIADRSEVSGDARKVWKYYANNRSSVSKDFLDPGGYTDTEYDDCATHGPRVDPLRTATRLMAIDYFENMWPSEHAVFKEEASMGTIMDAGDSDGDYYFETVIKWIEENQDEYGLDEWDIDYANGQWYEWKIDEEPELVRQLDSGYKFDDPDFLNLSYNTNYAVSSFEEMEENHYAFVNEISELIPGSEESFYEDPEALHFAVRDFFRERA